MKVPKARRLPSGKWFIQLRLGGESIPITTRTEKECIRQAQYIKAEYQAGKRISKEEKAATLTLSEAIDKYIAARGNILSPSTVGGYRCIQRTKFKSIMHRRLGEIPEKEWQKIVNQEAALCSPKTLKNAFAFVRSVIQSETGQPLPPSAAGRPYSQKGLIPSTRGNPHLCRCRYKNPLRPRFPFGAFLHACIRNLGPQLGRHPAPSRFYPLQRGGC